MRLRKPLGVTAAGPSSSLSSELSGCSLCLPEMCVMLKQAAVQATVVVNATTDMKIYREETFGPAMPVFKFKYDEEAIKMANDTE